jgi:hypothetical protein
MKQILLNFATVAMTAKRHLLSLVFILVFLSANGQNGIIGAGFTNGWGTGDIIGFVGSAGSSRITTLQPRGTGSGNRFFRLVRNWDNNFTQFGPFNCVDTDWTNPGVTYGMFVCNTNGAFFINCPNTTDNYVFKTPNGNTATTLLYFRVQGAVRTINSVSQFPIAGNVAPCSGTTVTANLSGELSAGQAVYLRYTKDNYATSTVLPLTGSGTTYSVVIPQAFNTLNANVSYYVFTSGTQTPSAANADLYTINLNNNGGSNYTYTVNTATTTTWNGSVWSTCTPTSAIDAIIAGTYTTTTNGAISAKSLTVTASGSLTIATGTNVTVQNAVTNNGTMTIQNNANLIQVNNVANSGSVTVNRNGSTLKRLDYTLWSSPVASQNLFNFSPLTVTPRFYTYNEGIDKFSVVSNPSGTTFTPGRSFFIRMPDQYPANSGNGTSYYAGSTTLAYPGVFTGTLNNGNISVTLTKGLNGYQAVGNPYPSVIDATAFINANAANIENTLYFWRKTNGASGSSYATWTLGGATSVTPTSGTPNGKIQVGQGFIVQAKNAGTVANFFTNAMRDEAPSSTQFFKVKQQAQKDRVWLNLTGPNDVFSQALVAYIDDATLGLDKYDGKYINDSGIALTTSINKEEYTIQARPAFDATDVVALNFKTSVAGTYNIAIDHVDGLFSKGQDIYLVDKTTGTTTNLNEGAYTFTAAVGVDNTRFTLTYQKTLKVDAPLFNENSVLVSRNNGTLNVKSNAVAINNVKVYDVQGRLVAERKNVKSNTATISNVRASQVLFVKVTSENNAFVTKKVLN